jgi:hypothetical protein
MELNDQKSQIGQSTRAQPFAQNHQNQNQKQPTTGMAASNRKEGGGCGKFPTNEIEQIFIGGDDQRKMPQPKQSGMMVENGQREKHLMVSNEPFKRNRSPDAVSIYQYIFALSLAEWHF